MNGVAGLRGPTAATAAPPLAEGLELLGEYQGSGSTNAQYLLRRRDGRVIVVSRLLYCLVVELGQRRSLDEVAGRLTEALGRGISPENVAYLMEHKLEPLGIVSTGSEPLAAPATAFGPRRPARPMLALTVRRAVVPERLVLAAANLLRPLFIPAVIATFLGAFVAMDAWLLLAHPLRLTVRDVLEQPGLVLVVVAITVAAGAFHELGHAAGGRYGGARPGVVGVGIYLIWPAFFSDLTDSYRLSRAGRLRADLGGVYFNVVFMLFMAGLYGITGLQVLLVVVVLQHLVVAQQFLPFLRLDGYYVVSDLVGVPDLFARIKPVLASLVPGRPADRTVRQLKPGARLVVTAWVLVTIVLMCACLVLLATALPRTVVSTWRFAVVQATLVAAFMRSGDIAGVLGGVRLLALAIPVTGLTVTILRAFGERRYGRSARSVPPATTVAAPDPAWHDAQGSWRLLARLPADPDRPRP
ncbi:MAG: hypothetical protein ACRD12_20210 [Acidimicrobiales bacterium]